MGITPSWAWHETDTHPGCLCYHPAPTPTKMASSYPPPFEGTGEVKEGFLCPLCLKDLQSFYQLQEHYEEEHSGDDRHVRGQLKSELYQTKYAHHGGAKEILNQKGL